MKNKKLITGLICCFAMASTAAQEVGNTAESLGYKSAFQTNLLAPVRVNQAINFTWLTIHPTTGNAWTVGADLIFNRLELGDADQKILNGFQTQMGGAGFNLYLGYRFYEPKSKFNRGIEFEYGYLPFRHQQLLCTASERIVELCRCNQLETHEFESQNNRLGLSFRLGYTLPINQRASFEAFLKVGVLNYFRAGFQNQRNHIGCDGTMLPLREDFYGGIRATNLLEFHAASPNIRITPLAQFGFNFQLK